MYILTKTNYQDFENEVENFETLKEAQDAMQCYFAEDKKTVEELVGDEIDSTDDATLYIYDDCAVARCEEFWMEYHIHDFSNRDNDTDSAKELRDNNQFLNRSESEIHDFLENRMVMFRGTKKDIAKYAEDFFGKTPDAVYESEEEDKDCDYHMSIAFSEETPNGTNGATSNSTTSRCVGKTIAM